MRAEASPTISRAIFPSTMPAPAASVSARCFSIESPGAIAAAMPPCAQADDAPCPIGAAASTILRGLVDVALIGADRITANGDVANKVGSVALALACRRAGIPFVVAAPFSTVDLATAAGGDIVIEE